MTKVTAITETVIEVLPVETEERMIVAKFGDHTDR